MPKLGDEVKTIYFLDFSLPRIELERLCREEGKIVVVLDHHITAQEDLRGLHKPEKVRVEMGEKLFAWFDMSESGATIAWKFFSWGGIRSDGEKAWDRARDLTDEGLPLFFDYLRDRDLWLLDLDETEEVHTALSSHAMDFHVWNGLMSEIGIERLKEEGRPMVALKRAKIEEMCSPDRVLWVEMGEGKWLVPVVNATCWFSECGEYLCKEYGYGMGGTDKREGKFAGYFFYRGDGKIQWGLRSRAFVSSDGNTYVEAFDVGKIALEYGGGGHRAASGFVTEGEFGVVRELKAQLEMVSNRKNAGKKGGK